MRRTFLSALALVTLAAGSASGSMLSEFQKGPTLLGEELERTTRQVPFLGEAIEAYYSSDGERLVFNSRHFGDQDFHVYTARVDGTEITRVNNLGSDACSFFFPDSFKIIWTSTRDNLGMGGSWENPDDYPQGAELYISDIAGNNRVRLTGNLSYDAEVSVSPNGKWILFTRQTGSSLDLWKMHSDGSGESPVLLTADWQETGAYFMPDSETIVYSAWPTSADGSGNRPMSLFSVKLDGSDLKRITNEEGSQWRPFPTPDGKHVLYNKLIAPRNWEIYLLNLVDLEDRRLTFNESFEGYPAISPDGKTMIFSSTRNASPGSRAMYLHYMDLSDLELNGTTQGR